MLDMKTLRDNPEAIIKALDRRGESHAYLRDVVTDDERRREIIQRVEKLKAEHNETSRMIGMRKREGKPIQDILDKIEENKATIKALDDELRAVNARIDEALLNTPNIPHASVPFGKDETENPVLRTWGEKPVFDFEPESHWDLGTALDILDFERAAKIAASRFVVYKGLGARLERALINFMMDMHTEKGYQETLLPYIVNRDSMTASGQFPKFEGDAFALKDERGLYLNPTAEVPAINLHRDEIIAEKDLPIHYAAFTTAFRQEAGSAGRDTRGIIRLHQFNKVELIKVTKPEDSYDALEAMLKDSEAVLQALNLPYRVVELCTGDLGFAMAKTYDIEVWVPSYHGYREIGSISNAESYQARRANIKYRTESGKPAFVHTLNGSGLAVGRTVVALLENGQQKDGTIKLPDALIPYMRVDKIT